MIRVFICDAMHLGGPQVIFVRYRLHEALRPLNNFIIPYDDNAHAARTGHLAIGCFKVDGGEVIQMVFGDVRWPFRIGPVSFDSPFL